MATLDSYPRKHSDAEAALKGRPVKKIGYQTWVERTEAGDIALRHFATRVMTFHQDNSVTLDAKGFRSKSTRERLDDCVPRPYRIFQKKSLWWYGTFDGDPIPFFDGLVIDGVTGKPLNGPTTEEVKADLQAKKAIEKRIKKYVDGYIDMLVTEQVEVPSNGDCWTCLGLVTDFSSGEVVDDGDHLLSHMDENYYVPSLAINAMREAGFRPAGIQIMLGLRPDSDMMGGTSVHVQTVRRSLMKYMRKRLIK